MNTFTKDAMKRLANAMEYGDIDVDLWDERCLMECASVQIMRIKMQLREAELTLKFYAELSGKKGKAGRYFSRYEGEENDRI